jgi:hypothetical protein
MAEQESQYHLKAKNREEELENAPLINDMLVLKGDAKGVDEDVREAISLGISVATAAHNKVKDKEHVNATARFAWHEASDKLHVLLVNFIHRFCKIPPWEEQDFEDMGMVRNSTNKKKRPTPVGSIYPTIDHTGAGQFVVYGKVQEGSLVDPPGVRKGMVIRSLLRKVEDPRQIIPGLLSDVTFCGGMRKVVNYGPENVSMVADISIALKNGSGETGPFSKAISVVLS